jgi:two-component system sensor histidine kinase/response regulator
MPDGQVPWDAARTLKSLGGDERLFHEIINIFLEEAPRQMASMREALALGDKHATERIAHTLKGELGYLGITEASRNARELEDAGRNGDMERAATIQASLETDVENLVHTMRAVLAGKHSGLSLVRTSGAN